MATEAVRAGAALPGFAEFDSGSESRRLAWALRAVTLVAAINGLAAAAAVFGLVSLLPLKTVEPMLLTVDRAENAIVRVSPFTKGAEGFRLMTEALVRRYVDVAHTVQLDPKAMQRRWGGDLYRMSGQEVFEDLREAFAAPAQKLLDRKISRGVEIEGDPRLLDEQGGQLYYQVTFRTIDSRLMKTVSTRRWIASLVVAFLPDEVAYEDRYINPLGFRVIRYSIAAAGAAS